MQEKIDKWKNILIKIIFICFILFVTDLIYFYSLRALFVFEFKRERGWGWNIRKDSLDRCEREVECEVAMSKFSSFDYFTKEWIA